MEKRYWWNPEGMMSEYVLDASTGEKLSPLQTSDRLNAIEAKNAALKTTLEDVKLFLGGSSIWSLDSSDMINRIDAALAPAPKVKE